MSDAKDTTTRETPAQTPLAIVGIGAMFPQADGLGAYWQNVQGGVDAITDVPETHWNVEDAFW